MSQLFFTVEEAAEKVKRHVNPKIRSFLLLFVLEVASTAVVHREHTE